MVLPEISAIYEFFGQYAIFEAILRVIGKNFIISAIIVLIRKLFWKQLDEKLYRYPVDAWWMAASDPVKLSYCWGDFVPGNLRTTARLPFVPFEFDLR